MKFLILILAGLPCLAQAANKIGLLKQIKKGDETSFAYAEYITKGSGGWKGAKILEHERAAKRSATKLLVTFEGASIGSISPEKDYQILKDLTPEIQAKFAELAKQKRPLKLLTTTLPKFSDPEKWKFVKGLAPGAKEAEIRRQLKDLASGCVQEIGKPAGKYNVNKFRIKSSYTSAAYGKKRYLVRIENPSCLQYSAVPESANATTAHPIWLARAADGTWTRKYGGEVLGFGDFDGSGHSLGLLYQADETTTPDGILTMLDLQNFSELARATDEGY